MEGVEKSYKRLNQKREQVTDMKDKIYKSKDIQNKFD